MAKLERRGDDGCTVRQHLEAAVAKGGRGAAEAEAQLKLPPCPDEMLHLVEHAFELHGSSEHVVSYAEIGAYMDRMDVELEPFQVHAIRTLDAALLAAYAEKEPKAEGGGAVDGRPVKQPEVPQWKKRPEGVEPQFAKPI